jgi:hypothetical protein
MKNDRKQKRKTESGNGIEYKKGIKGKKSIDH